MRGSSVLSSTQSVCTAVSFKVGSVLQWEDLCVHFEHLLPGNVEHSQTCIPLAFFWARNKMIFYHQFMTARKFSWPHMASVRLLNSRILSRLIDSHDSFMWSKTTASLCSTFLSADSTLTCSSIMVELKLRVQLKPDRPLIIVICWVSYMLYANMTIVIW